MILTATGSGSVAAKQKVLVTRPQPQADEFIELLNDNGVSALAFSSIEICPEPLNVQLESQLKSLNDNDLIIFVSINAVEQTVNLLQQLNLTPESVSTKIATIGQASLAAAQQAGFNVSLSPESGFNTQSLLAIAELQAERIQGMNCLIVRGIGGLENLANELQSRGARVSYAEVYRRQKPQKDKNISRQQLSENWDDFGINAITATSNESLQNLYDMLEFPGKTAMLKTVLVVASWRAAELAKKLGFSSVRCAKSALNQHMLAEILNETE